MTDSESDSDTDNKSSKLKQPSKNNRKLPPLPKIVSHPAGARVSHSAGAGISLTAEDFLAHEACLNQLPEVTTATDVGQSSAANQSLRLGRDSLGQSHSDSLSSGKSGSMTPGAYFFSANTDQIEPVKQCGCASRHCLALRQHCLGLCEICEQFGYYNFLLGYRIP